MNPALLVIDVQQGLDDPQHGPRNNPDFERNLSALLDHWRGRGWPVIHIAHDSTDPESVLQPGLPGHAFKPEAEPAPGEILFRKSTNSGFIGTGLEDHLRREGIDYLVVTGMTTGHCVSATTRNAADLGFTVTVVADATSSHGLKGYDGRMYSAEEIHDTSLATLQGEFATIAATEELIRDAD